MRGGKADHPSPLFVPETEAEASQTGEQGERLDGVEEGFGAVASLEMVIGDARAQVVDVMEADIAGKPLEKPWQFIV